MKYKSEKTSKNDKERQARPFRDRVIPTLRLRRGTKYTAPKKKRGENASKDGSSKDSNSWLFTKDELAEMHRTPNQSRLRDFSILLRKLRRYLKFYLKKYYRKFTTLIRKHTIQTVVNLWSKHLAPVPMKYKASGVIGAIILLVLVITLGGSQPEPQVAEVLSEEQTNTAIPKPANLKAFLPSETETTEPQFDPLREVLSYQTKINEADVTVSQQPFPENLENTPEALSNLATTLTNPQQVIQFSTNKGIVALATNENASQTLIFATDEILSFITSTKTFDIEDWIFFVNSLALS